MSFGLLSTINYRIQFYFYSVLSILRKQHFKLNNCEFTYHQKFQLSTRTKNQWQKLFPHQVNTTPYCYYWPNMVKMFHRLIYALGINYINVLHLKHEQTFYNNNLDCEHNHIKSRLVGIIILKQNKIALKVKSEITNSKQQLVTEFVDYIFIKNINNYDMNKIMHLQIRINENIEFSRLTQKQSQLKNNTSCQPDHFTIPPNMGRYFGKVSGDLNPIHTNKWFIKLFKYRNTFIQGMCLYHYILQHYINTHHQSPEILNITFANPVYEHQVITYCLVDNHVEILDELNTLLAYGQIK